MEEIATKIVAGERRLTLLLMGHWQELRAGRRAPLVRALKTGVPPDLLIEYRPERKSPDAPTFRLDIPMSAAR